MKLFVTLSIASAAAVAASTLFFLLPTPIFSQDDFEAFNSILDGASIVIPETFEVSERVGIATLDMKITNLKCYDMAIGDVTVQQQQQSDTQFVVEIGIFQLDLTCELNYVYDYGILSGDGWVQISTDNNMAQSILSFTSTDFNTAPPLSSSVESCLADVKITRMDFEEDFASEVLEVFQGLIRGTVERAVGDVACSELSSIGTSLVANMVDLAGENLGAYQGDMGEAVTDPLYLERNLDLPSTLVPLNLQGTEGEVGRTFNQLLLALDEYLGTSIPDPDGVSLSGNDLAVNVMLRSLFLEDRAFVVDPSTLGMEPLLFEGHDRITQFSISLNQVRVLGLDTFTRFNPFRSIGRHTVQNELTWDSLTVEFDVTVDIKPSTLEDAILQDPASPGINERVTVALTVNKVDVEASVLLVLDEERLGSMELGPFFYTENILPCILSIVHNAQVSGLDVDPTYVNEPTLSGFLSAGLDRVITDSVEVAFAMYAGVLRDAIPNVFQTSVRDLINTFFVDTYLDGTNDKTCPEVKPAEGFIDFPTFLNAESDIYGDVPSLLKEMLDEELLTVNNDTTRPRINDVFVAPFTKMQSGASGTFLFPGDLVGFLSKNVLQFGLESVELRMFDAKVQNIDSMGTPIALLEPNTQNGMVLDNSATIGFPNKKLRIGVTGLFATEGDETLTMSNEMDLAVELTASDAFVSLLAKVDAISLYKFLIKDVTSSQCWLNTIAAPMLREDGSVAQGSGFSIESLLLSTQSMNFNFSCTSCTSPSLSILPEVMASFEAAGVSDVLEKRLVDLGVELIRSDFTQGYIDSLLADAALQCPHSATYVGPTATAGIALADFPPLPYESLETIAFAAAVGMEVGIIVAAEAHQDHDGGATTPLSAQNEFKAPVGVRIMDFTSLGTSLGDWAESGLDGILDYLSETVSDSSGPNGSDLRVNSLLRTSLLDETGRISFRLDEVSAGALGLEFGFSKLNILGLDTITQINLMNAVAPQTMQNTLKWKSLGLQFVMSLKNTSNDGNGGGSRRDLQDSQDVMVTLQLADVQVSLATFLAMDLDRLGSLELKSVLKISNILPCLLSAAHEANITEFDVSVGSIESFTIEGFQSNTIIAAAGESTRLLLNNYAVKIVSSIPAIFDSTFRTVLNHWMQYHMGDASDSICRSSMEASDPFFVDLRDLLWSVAAARQLGGTGMSQYGDLFRTGMGWIQNMFKVDKQNGLSNLNDVVVAPLTDEGNMVYSGDLFNGGTSVTVGALDANVVFRVYDARVDNLDTIGAPIELLGGVMGEPYHLNNTITFGVHEEPLRFSSKLLLSLDGDDDIQINNQVDVSLELFNASMIFSTMSKIAESRFFGFPLRDVLNINCWLATIPAPTLDSRGIRAAEEGPTASLSELEAFIGQMVLKADCVDCSSPRMTELTAMLSAPEAQDEIKDVANGLLQYVTTLMGGKYLQVTIDRLLNDAARQCPHNAMFDENFEPAVYDVFEAPDTSNSMHYLVLLTGLIVALLVVASTVVLVIRFIVRRRHKRWIMKLPAHQVKRLARQQRQEDQVEDRLNAITQSMFRSPDVPCVLRWGMPLVLLLNIAFFLSGHLSLGATVNIEAEVAGERFKIENFFEFSMARSTVEIWRAGGKELAILIMIFSIFWPYTRLIMTLVLWFAPPSRVSVSGRGSILLWLDWLAKWSMIDIFVLVISIAAFRVSIQSPDTTYLPDDFYSIEMMVIPLWGLYANMTAQLLSQISSHFIIHHHRRIVSRALGAMNAGYLELTGRRDGDASMPTGAQVRSDSSDVARAKGGTMVTGLPPMAESKPIHDNQSYSKRSAAAVAVPETPQAKEMYVSDSESGGTSASFDDIQILIAGSDHLESNSNTVKAETMSLSHHRFSRPHRGETETLVARRWVNKLLVFSAACTTILVVVGCVLPSFSLEIFGLVGVAVEFGQDFRDATTAHSVFSVIKLLFEQASYLGTAKDYIGLGVLTILFLSTVLVVPIIQSLALLRQWFSKSTHEEKMKRSVRIEILQAWEYSVVYLVAVFVASWQLGPVSDSMINSYCENLQDMLAQMAFFGILKEEDAQCFSVTSSIENGSFVMASAAVALGFLSSFVAKAATQYLRDASETERRIQEDIAKSARFSDQTSRTDDDHDDDGESGFDATIHPVPVLFTDSFRWLLRSDNLSSSARALFADPNSAHWSLPEATAVVDGKYVEESFPPNQNAAAKGAAVAAAGRGRRSKKEDSMSSVSESRSSFASRYSGRPRKLAYDDIEEEKQSYRSSNDRKPAARSPLPSVADHRSVSSRMDSVGSSFRDEPSVASALDSLAYSYPSEAQSSLKPPPSPPALLKSSLYPAMEDIPTSSSPSPISSHRKAPPPSAYRLATKQRSLIKPSPNSPHSAASSSSTSHHIFEDRDADDGVSNRSSARLGQRSSKKSPPQIVASSPPSPPQLNSMAPESSSGFFSSLLQQQQQLFHGAVANDDGLTTVTTGDDHTAFHDEHTVKSHDSDMLQAEFDQNDNVDAEGYSHVSSHHLL